MRRNINLLDCTLRDGAYVVDGNFGDASIKGIIKKLIDAKVDVVECGWLKNAAHEQGSTYFHVPADLEPYIEEKNPEVTYVAMIDYNRYDVGALPDYDGKSIDAVRVVFPYGKMEEGLSVAQRIKEKGYQIYIQAANTLAYGIEDLVMLASAVNTLQPTGISIVDTFGAMYTDDLERITGILNRELDESIQLGFHSHNNQQLAFSLVMHFIRMLKNSKRGIVVDATLCGMGRGAGNAATELVCNYLNRKENGNYDMDVVMDAIDIYMSYFQEKFTWGYSTPYFIAGMYCCHVNNIAYLQKNHRTNSRDMRNIIQSMQPEDRKRYDYDLLEKKYTENQNRIVEDEAVMEILRRDLQGKKILLLAPGKTIVSEQEKVKAYIEREKPIIIGINALHQDYDCDYLFLISSVRYTYAKEVYAEKFRTTKKILLSCIKTNACENEYIINFSRVVQYGWEHFDNAVITCLRFLDRLHVKKVAIAGFDAFLNEYNESYADSGLPTLNPNNQRDDLNKEIMSIFLDFKAQVGDRFHVQFVTSSMFDEK